MTRDEVQGVLERHTAAWKRRDSEALTADHADDGVIYSPIFGRVEGLAQIERSYESLFDIFPDWDIRFGAALIDGNRVAQPFTAGATQRGEFLGYPATGKRCVLEGVSLSTVNDRGLIAEERRTYDFTALLAQLGVIRAKLSR